MQAWEKISVSLTRAGIWMAKQFQRLGLWVMRWLAWVGRLQVPRLPFSLLQWILLAYVLGGLLYSLATPPLEAGYEAQAFARVMQEDPSTWGESAFQPPLYYALAGQISAVFDTSDRELFRQPNPYSRPFDPFAEGNKNRFLRDITQTPHGTNSAVFVLRLLNVALGAVAVWAVYRIGGMLSAQRPALAPLTAFLFAFNPMFLFSMASLGSLALGISLNSVAVLALLMSVRQGMDWRRLGVLALALGLGVGVHLSAWGVLVAAIPVLLFATLRQSAWGRMAAFSAGLALLIAVLWGASLLDNNARYGDPLALGAVFNTTQARSQALLLGDALGEFGMARISYWGMFGSGNIPAQPIVYLLTDLMSFSALFGVLFAILQLYAIRDFSHARRELLALLVLLSVALVAMLAYGVALFSLRQVPVQILLSYSPVFAPLLASGLLEIYWWMVFFLMPPDRSFVRAGDAVPHEALAPLVRWSGQALAFFALMTPLMTIAPSYSAPMPLADLPAGAMRVYARFGDVELLGYEVQDKRYSPLELVRLTLYWRTLATMPSDGMVSLGLVSPQGEVLGKVDSLPVGGRLRSSQWQVGQIYADTYSLRLSGLATGAYPLRAQVTWWDRQAQARLTPVNERGESLSAVLLNVGALVAPIGENLAIKFASLDAGNASRPPFGGLLRPTLFAFEAPTGLLRVEWEAVQPIAKDYSFFAHVYDAQGTLVNQADIFPDLWTRYWRAREGQILSYNLRPPVQAGNYEVHIGVYDASSMQRLALNPDELEAPPITTYRLFGFSVGADGAFSSPELEALFPEVTPEATPASEVTLVP